MVDGFGNNKAELAVQSDVNGFQDCVVRNEFFFGGEVHGDCCGNDNLFVDSSVLWEVEGFDCFLLVLHCLELGFGSYFCGIRVVGICVVAGSHICRSVGVIIGRGRGAGLVGVPVVEATVVLVGVGIGGVLVIVVALVLLVVFDVVGVVVDYRSSSCDLDFADFGVEVGHGVNQQLEDVLQRSAYLGYLVFDALGHETIVCDFLLPISCFMADLVVDIFLGLRGSSSVRKVVDGIVSVVEVGEVEF